MRTTLRAVSIDPKEWKEKGNTWLQRVRKHRDSDNKRHNHIHFETKQSYELSLLAELRFAVLAAEAFRIAGEQCWYDSAKAYALAASLSADQSSKALFYSEAGKIAEKMDNIAFSTEYYRQAVTAHCDALEFKAAALLIVRMAKNYAKHDNLSASIEEFEKASRFFEAAGMVNEAEQALEKAAYLLGKTGNFVESSKTYKRLAMSQMDRNTKIFNAPRYALRSAILLCVDASSSSPLDFSGVQDLIDEICKKDCRFIESRELAFIHDILYAISSTDLDQFADCVYSFNEIAELDDMMLNAFEEMRENIVSNKQTRQITRRA